MTLILFAISAVLVWAFILRPQAYPSNLISTRVKWIHALFFFLIFSQGLMAARGITWFLHNLEVLIAVVQFKPTELGGPLAGFSQFLMAATSLPLMAACVGIAFRRRHRLKTFLVLWTVMYLGSLCWFLTGGDRLTMGSMVVVAMVWTALFLSSFWFYSRREVVDQLM